MTPNQARLNQNPILTGMFRSAPQSGFIATELFPNLPQKLSESLFGEMGMEALRRYELSRSPGSNTKRVNITIKGKTYTLKQKAVDVPIARELFEEVDYMRQALNVTAYPEISQLAMNTVNDILALDYELDVADMVKTPGTYPTGNVITLAGAQKWSDPNSDPVADVKAAKQVIRQKTGAQATTFSMGPTVETALLKHPKIVALLSNTNDKIVTRDHLKRFFEVDRILVGESIWADDSDSLLDVWGNMALLSYSPKIQVATASLLNAPFGVTSVKEGHPFAEPVRYDGDAKSYIFGGTYERKPNLIRAAAGVLFDQPI